MYIYISFHHPEMKRIRVMEADRSSTEFQLPHTLADPLSSFLLFFFLIFIYLFIYLWLCWVFVSVRGLSPVAASGGHSSSRCAGLSLSWPLSLRSTGSRRAGSAIVAHGPSRPVACGIFPDQASNPCALHWQADSQPLRHQETLPHPSQPQFLSDKMAVQYNVYLVIFP